MRRWPDEMANPVLELTALIVDAVPDYPRRSLLTGTESR